MTESSLTETPEDARPNRKREVTATVTTAAVTVVLSIAANILVGKVATRVHDTIAPPSTKSESE
jgi:hypothetical protein